ncbi:MAG: hypothetical protein AB8H80_05880 [Planctomycetota bacterium]
MNRLHLLFAMALGAGAANAQQTWTVGPNGQFSDLPPAVAAASAGDTIMIEANVNMTYTPTTIQKGLHLAGSGFGTNVRSLVISGVPSDERVIVQDLTVLHIPVTPFFTEPALVIENCPGLVSIDNCTQSGVGKFALSIVNSDFVVLRECFVSAAAKSHELINSTISAADTQIYRSVTTTTDAAMEMHDSELTLTRCRVEAIASLFTAMHAIRVDNSTVRLVSSSLVATTLPQVAAIIGECPAPSRVLQASNSPSTGVSLSGCVTATTQQTPTLALSDVAVGSTSDLEVFGDAGATALVFVGAPANTLQTTPLGQLALSPTNSILVASATVPALAPATIAFPNVPSTIPVGTLIALQAVSISGQQVMLSTPTIAAVR